MIVRDCTLYEDGDYVVIINDNKWEWTHALR